MIQQKELREKQIGIEPIANMEEALRRNLEIGVARGMVALPQIIKNHLESTKGEYLELLEKEREV